MSNFYPPSRYDENDVDINEVKMQSDNCMHCEDELYHSSAVWIRTKGDFDQKHMYVRHNIFEGNPTIDGHKVFCSERCLDAVRVARHVANGLRRYKVTWRLSVNTEITTYVWVNPKSWSDDEDWNEYGDSKEQVIQNTAADLIGQTHSGISEDYLRYFDTVSDRDYRFRKVFDCTWEEVKLI